MPFAIVEREREGIDAILMVVEEEAEAEAIVFELRRHDVRADVRTTGPERSRRDHRWAELARPRPDALRWE